MKLKRIINLFYTVFSVITVFVAESSCAQGISCATAVNVTMNGACASGTISDASIEGTTPSPSCGNGNREGWYKFTATSANATITAVSSNRQLLVQVFSGACGSLTEIGCGNNANTAGSQTETVSVSGLTVGNIYYVRIVDEVAQNMTLTSLCIISATYCTASGGNDEYISGVVCGSINNTGTTADGYHDYTTMSTSMSDCGTYPITVTNGNGYASDQCGVWIDWNQDGDFSDANETISMTGTPGEGPYNGTISVPSSATLGNTRMRVRITYSGTLNACGADSYGEVEDYTINVVAGSVPKTVSSVTVTQASTANTYSSATDQEILGIAIEISGSLGVLNLNSVKINSNNTSDVDICGIKLYVTSAPVFSTATPIGGSLTFSAGTLTISGLTYNLPGCSTTYFWVAYDICPGAVGGHVADAIIPKDGIKIGGSTYPNSNQSPAGNRPIVLITPGSCSGSGAIMNGRFEAPVVTLGSAPQISEGTSGLVWQTTATDNLIEIWSTGYDDVGSIFTAYEGNQSAEINATMAAGLYQDITTIPCTQLTWSVAHRGRNGIDTMGVYIGPTNNVVFQRKCGTDNTAWVVYTGNYNVPAGQTTTRFEFRAISTSNGVNSVGNLIDDVRFYCTGNTVTVNSPVICSGSSTSLIASGGTSYTWSNGLGTGNTVVVNPPVTTTYTVTATTSPGCTITSSCIVTVNGCLPVDLLSFEVKCQNGVPLIKWTTASEENNDYFMVEGSENGTEYMPLGIVDGSGNSNDVKEYIWTNEMSTNGIHYFRLGQTDFNGHAEYFSPIMLNNDCDTENPVLTLLNNPITDNIDFKLIVNHSDNIIVSVYDARGRMLKKEKFVTTPGINIFSINAVSLPQGAYFLCAESNNRFMKLKFIKKF